MGEDEFLEKEDTVLADNGRLVAQIADGKARDSETNFGRLGGQAEVFAG